MQACDPQDWLLSCWWTITLPRQGVDWEKDILPEARESECTHWLALRATVRDYLNINSAESPKLSYNENSSSLLTLVVSVSCNNKGREDKIRSEPRESWESPVLLFQRWSCDMGQSSIVHSQSSQIFNMEVVSWMAQATTNGDISTVSPGHTERHRKGQGSNEKERTDINC